VGNHSNVYGSSSGRLTAENVVVRKLNLFLIGFTIEMKHNTKIIPLIAVV
jgi:hypothetical protein